MTGNQALFEYLLHRGDNALILAQRLGEWCGHAHQLESDIALTNVALDQMGQARMLLTEAGRVEAKGRSEDDLAFFRVEREFRNALLVEVDNGDFARTITRQFLFDIFQFHTLKALRQSENEFLVGFATKSLKEVTYHRTLSTDWMKRLGDGTALSHDKMQDALNVLWEYTPELFDITEGDAVLTKAGIIPDMEAIKIAWNEEVRSVIAEATLEIPNTLGYEARGGRIGHHTEHMGYILAEMQYLPRTMPEAKW